MVSEITSDDGQPEEAKEFQQEVRKIPGICPNPKLALMKLKIETLAIILIKPQNSGPTT